MARPIRKNVDYFPHYLSDGKKMYFIEHKYGNDGYAVWFKLLESLASTNDHWLNLNDRSNIMFLSAKCKVSEEMLFNILNDLSDLGEISKELWQSKVIWSDKFIESIEDAYTRRNNKCIDFDSLCQHLLSLGIHKPNKCRYKNDINTQSKVKERKVNESIEERKLKFAETLKPFVEKYGREFLNDFYLYWTEPTQDNKQLNFELQKTWSLDRRLSTWLKQAKKFGNNLPKHEQKTFWL
jgi:hypothetical protein